ncbi:MAG: prepilin-type N-terminal cleavage/methylation domain-containing protein [Nitrospiraceae bacterium]|nr:MAG: prepilin-type N-terminal cleavage/methylation domain-containing protein [Nitrospiraceae bacterium]
MRKKAGFTLVEILVVISIAAILAVIGVPQYGRFVAKNKVRGAASDLLQNMRLARTMAIKENRPYVFNFNPGANSYTIGFDINGDSIPDGFGAAGPVRTVNLQQEYGPQVRFGTSTGAGPDQPTACPACTGIGGSTVAFGALPLVQTFNTDGTVASTGTAFLTHNRGFTYMLRITYLTGKVDLYKWDGDLALPNPPIVNNCNASPVRYCGWTEVR